MHEALVYANMPDDAFLYELHCQFTGSKYQRTMHHSVQDQQGWNNLVIAAYRYNK